MRILVVGAGAIGGYFGGRLKAAGRDVTFLVRSRRAVQLAKTGLVIRSPLGNVELPSPPTVAAENIRTHYDLILLSCKAYDLASAIDSFAPAVGPNTAILPLLNGMAHIDALTARFGAGAVLGGQCVISSTLDDEGRVVHLAPMHFLSFGERDGAMSPRAQAILAALSGAGFDANLSTAIMQEMWEKWAFIAAGAGITCLMRAAFGDIIAAGAVNLTTEMYDECCAIAAANGHLPSKASAGRSLAMFTAKGSTISASMMRDIERGAPIEADHVIGDLLRRGEKAVGGHRLLRLAYAHMKSYEARRNREKSTAAAA
jgi:2-dehydropantoate 2-reductase